MTSGEPDQTVVGALDQLRQAGYAADFAIRDGRLICGRCHHPHSPHDAVIERITRVEGESDPADEAIVAGLQCLACGARGVLVAGYGPTADPAEADVLRRLVDGRS